MPRHFEIRLTELPGHLCRWTQSLFRSRGRVRHRTGGAVSDTPRIVEPLEDRRLLDGGGVVVNGLPVVPDEIGALRLGDQFRGFLLDVNGNGDWDKAAGGDKASLFLDLNKWKAGDVPVTGDFNGDGQDELGIRRFGPNFRGFLLDLNGDGMFEGRAGGDIGFKFFGHNQWRVTDQPIVGDWDGDGTDEIGVHRGKSFLLDANGNHTWDGVDGGDLNIPFATLESTAIIGDWNGDDVDDLGAHRGQNFYLDLNGNRTWDGRSGGDANYIFGSLGTGPIAGDWDGNGVDEIGAHEGRNYWLDMDGDGRWGGVPNGDVKTVFPRQPSLPVTGKWTPPPAPLLAAGGPAEDNLQQAVAPLTDEALAPIVEFVVDNAMQLPLSAAQQTALADLDVVIADLPGAQLGQALGPQITLDTDAAGYGWFVDPTPADNSEFQSGSPLSALDSQLRMDLVTAVMHEVGHALGYDHADDGVMQGELAAGIRRMWDELGDDVDFGV